MLFRSPKQFLIHTGKSGPKIALVHCRNLLLRSPIVVTGREFQLQLHLSTDQWRDAVLVTDTQAFGFLCIKLTPWEMWTNKCPGPMIPLVYCLNLLLLRSPTVCSWTRVLTVDGGEMKF